MRCLNCGSENPAGKRFCGDCAAPLNNGPPTQRAGVGERRYLTVLFCDLVGSTSLASRLDPEEWREIVADYHRAAADAIERFGGHVAQYLGDGVMAYFGWPKAYDNNAERAVRAGLGILDAISKLNEQATRPNLSVRIGIDSGGVVVGASAGKNADVFGDTPNIAARVQAVALPGTVVVTAETHRLISGLFVVEDCGTQTLKGIERSIRLYRIIRPSGVRGRLEAVAAARGLTPFVGREEELRLLMSLWVRTLEGEGQAVLITGEGGIGKSRLVQHFHQQIARTPHAWAEAAATPLFQNTPFYQVSELLRQLLPAPLDASPDDQVARLGPVLEMAGLKSAEAIPAVARLLNLPLPAKHLALSASPAQQRRRLLATLIEWVRGTARVQPLVIAAEDLHWADPSTVELLELLLEQSARARLFVLYTARPEFRSQWPLRAHHTQIMLNRLSSRNVRTMVDQVAAQKELPEETIAALVERTGGVPLFVEELTRAIIETGSAKLTELAIPVTLQDSLMARLDRLGSAREVLHVGAVIGREFSHELLQEVHSMAGEDLQRALSSLADAELLYVSGTPPEATYQFKHALIRDAAYETLLKSRRKELHRQVARAIDEKFPALKETHPEVLARHWTEAGETEAAINEWSRAGKLAEVRNAFSEALEGYQQAVSLLRLTPETPERDLRELEFRNLIFRMSWSLRGGGAPETLEAVERAAALAESGNLERYARSMVSKGGGALFSGDLAKAGVLADKALNLAISHGSPTLLAHAYFLQVVTRFMLGELAEMEKHFLAGVPFFDDPQLTRRSVAGVFSGASLGAWVGGRLDLARERNHKIMTLANPKNVHEFASTLNNAASLHAGIREPEQAERLAERALALSEQHQLSYQLALSRCVLGHATVQLGRASEGIALIYRGIQSLSQIGTPLRIAYYTALLAEAEAQQGNSTDALKTAQTAFLSKPDAPVFRPEILRIRGEIRSQDGSAILAEADFRESIALARRMGAKAWELRASTSLARLLDKQGRRHEARPMLVEIYNWFTEGFDTPDLKDARTLLEELSG